MNSSNGLPSPKEAEVLEMLLSGHEMYGLEMVRNSKGSLKRGTIYVTLNRLEEQRLVSSRADKADETGLSRRHYRITGQGTRALQAYQYAQSVMMPPLLPVGA